jgi:hypothetical protein
MVRIVRLMLLAAAACLASSCGFSRETRLPESGATLEGVVKYGGEQLQFAQILVIAEGKMATGRIGEEGRYRVENCPLGQVKVAVNTSAARGEYQSKAMAGGAYKGPNAKGKGAVALRFVDVPAKYFDPETSGLTTTVKRGSNTYDITIPK